MQRKKNPSDYPIFAFRVSQQEKADLIDAVEKLTESLNRNIGENDYVWRKNDVIIEALNLGLAELRRKDTRRRQGKR